MDEMNKAVEAMNMESALLVMSALGKGIDLSVWLLEGEDVPVEDFNDKFQHLALTLGIGEDWDTKQELDLAVSASSLGQLAGLFGKPSRKGVKCIDVTMFLNCSKQKVSAYLASMDEGGGEADSQTLNSGSPSTTRAVAPSASATTINSASSGASVMGDSVSQINEDEEEDDDDDEVDDELVVQGGLEVDEVALGLGGSSSSSMGAMSSPGQNYAKQSILPDSPYDEEVAFSIDDDDEADTHDQRRRRRGKQPPKQQKQPQPKAAVAVTNRPATAPAAPQQSLAELLPPTAAALAAPRPISAAPVRKSRAMSPEKIAEARELAASRVATSKHSPEKIPQKKSAGEMAIKGNEVRGGSFSRAPRSGLSPAKKRAQEVPANTRTTTPLSTSMSFGASSSAAAAAACSSSRENGNREGRASSPSNPNRVSTVSLVRQSTNTNASAAAPSLTSFVERKARHITQSTDLYHLVQVHLGFVDKYMYTPARGVIVPSRARPWLRVHDIQTAFMAARQAFTEAHVYALMKLVVAFAKTKGYESQGDGESLFSGVGGIVDVSSGCRKLSAEWLQKYFVHLRLTKAAVPLGASTDGLPVEARSSRDTPLEFGQWLGTKKAEDAKSAAQKDREFRKVLAGRKGDLDDAELDAMLVKNSIIPAESMKKEISLRVQAWVLDIDGRKDFSHNLHYELRRWSDDNKTEFARVTDAETRKKVLTDSKTKILKTKAESLRTSESTDQAITKNLFSLYRKYCRGEGHSTYTKNWGSWLAEHLADFEQLVTKSREVDNQREKLLIERSARKMQVAPLRVIEQKFEDCCEMMKNTEHAIEIRKCLVKLRKRAMEAGVGKLDNVLVTKALFDEEMAFVLAPYMMELTEELRGLAEEARFSHTSVGQTRLVDKQFEGLIGKLFKPDVELALKEGSTMKESKEQECAADFEAWKKRVAEKRQIEKDAAAALEEKEKTDEDKKKKKADRAYKKWLKLRKGGKYVTKTTDGKKIIRSLPSTKRVEHDARWSKDVEVQDADASFL
jgi:hypothetical protein